ncbi:calcium-binding protein [Aestuariivirga sp.]|uniref:calcium-binding protein n=1 Tax=Aestuariivirga sp. TaxID=2650926 RepID=UPI003918F1D3
MTNTASSSDNLPDWNMLLGNRQADADPAPDLIDEGLLLTGNDRGNNLTGSWRNDTIYGQGGNDVIDGGDGDDFIDGGTGNDRLYGGVGNDRIYGGDGNDIIGPGEGRDYIDGGSGVDTLDWSKVSSYIKSVNLGSGFAIHDTGEDRFTSIEDYIGGGGSDYVIGSDVGNVITGGWGDDYLDGLGGNDRLDGGQGSDTYNWSRGGGNDVIVEQGAGLDRLILGEGISRSDVSVSYSGSDMLLGIKGESRSAIKIVNYRAGGIEEVRFADGSTLILGTWLTSSGYQAFISANGSAGSTSPFSAKS